jgi:hypothetical protein
MDSASTHKNYAVLYVFSLRGARTNPSGAGGYPGNDYVFPSLPRAAAFWTASMKNEVFLISATAAAVLFNLKKQVSLL